MPCLRFHPAGNEVLEDEESNFVIAASAFQNIVALCLGIRQRCTVSAQGFPTFFFKKLLSVFRSLVLVIEYDS